jgi:glycosyltransferase involved in cell wall biosynthesis
MAHDARPLYYIANARMPTESAHGVQIAKMCEAFARAGAQVTLLVPRRRNTEAQDVFTAYGVERNFSVEYLPTIDLPLWLPGAFMLQTFVFATAALLRLAREPRLGLVYTRGEQPIFLAPFLPRRFALVWETHIKPAYLGRYARTARRASLLVAATKWYATEIPTLWPIEQKKVLYAPDGVALADFPVRTREVARQALALPDDKKIVLYAGSDLAWKGLYLLREASELLPEDTVTIFVGGSKEKGGVSSRRMFPGVRPYTEIPLWLAAADVLVMTGDPRSPIAREYTSPLKLFEYMAARRPIVATDLPATRDILSEAEAYLAPPDVVSLARTITEALMHPLEAAARARAARALVERYSWDARARGILSAISEV